MTHTKQLAARTALLAVVAAMGISLAAPVVANAAPRRLTNQDRTVTSAEVQKALQNTSGVLQASVASKTTTDGDSALVAATAGATVDVPKDAKRGVTLAGKDGTNVSVSLPNANVAGAAKQVANGVVSYPSATGAANAVQTNADGSVRMLTVIDNPSAPTRYDYRVSVPAGGHIVVNGDGSAAIIGKEGLPLATIDKPWAKDANGQPIHTRFITDGKALTQIVKHNVPGVVYPVTADPLVKRWYGWDYQFNRRQTNNIMLGMGLSTAASMGIPEPTISKFVGIALAAATSYAGWAYNKGGCLRIKIFYTGGTSLGHYYGGSCK